MINSMDIARRVSKKTGYTQKYILEVIKQTFIVIAEEVCAGNEVGIKNFGKFYAKDIGIRNLIHPVSGVPYHIVSQKTPKFRASENFKNDLK